MRNHTPGFHTLARAMFKHALAASAPQLGVKESAQVVERLRAGDCYRCDTLRYNLAKQIADYLATVDANMRAVYLYNPEYAAGEYDTPPSEASQANAINLIAWTRTKASLPVSTIAGLGNAFHSARATVLCDRASGWCFNLNLTVVTDTQVKARKGYAALIDSDTVRPTRVWAKQRAAV